MSRSVEADRLGIRLEGIVWRALHHHRPRWWRPSYERGRRDALIEVHAEMRRTLVAAGLPVEFMPTEYR